MKKHNVTRMDQSRRTRATDFGARKGQALVRQVMNGFQYSSTDAETAANETKQDWQAIIADKLADLQRDVTALIEDIAYYDERYGAIPGDAPLMDALAALGRQCSDVAQDHDNVWVDEQYAHFLAGHVSAGSKDDDYQLHVNFGHEWSDYR